MKPLRYRSACVCRMEQSSVREDKVFISGDQPRSKLISADYPADGTVIGGPWHQDNRWLVEVTTSTCSCPTCRQDFRQLANISSNGSQVSCEYSLHAKVILCDVRFP
jgi:hypothetical protein